MNFARETGLQASRLRETQHAFDSVASSYDGPSGNNAVIRRMRRTMWDAVGDTFTSGALLADLGCGTGLDAAHFGEMGYRVAALDLSPEMIARTRQRVQQAGLEDQISVHQLGIHEMDGLKAGPFDGMYSNLGAMNCVPHVSSVSGACARLLLPGGRLIVSVIGRYCPWEMAYYLIRGRPARALVRLRRGMVPVGLNGGTVWTRYYSPREFYRIFERHFLLTSYQALRLFSPPPYVIGLHRNAAAFSTALTRLDDRMGSKPVLRNAGDHFLMILTKRD